MPDCNAADTEARRPEALPGRALAYGSPGPNMSVKQNVGTDRLNQRNTPTRREPTPSERRVVYLLNPADDTTFRAAVEKVGTAATTPVELEDRLRTLAPRVVVRRRELEAEPVEVWYVYRDGHWIPHGEQR